MNTYTKLKLIAWVALVLLTYPAAYLMFAVDLGWATVPVIVSIAFVFYFLLLFEREAHKKANEHKEDS